MSRLSLLADGEKIASEEVTETVWGEDDHTGIWQWSFTVYKAQIKDAEEITVQGKEIPRYSVEVKESDTFTREVIGEDGEITEETVEVDPPYYEIIYTFNPDMPTDKVDRVEPTCTEDGNIEYWYLDTKNEDGETVRKYFTDMSGEEEITEEETILPALGHDWGDWIVTKEATETEEGSETRTCARCGETETRAIPASIAYRVVSGDGNTWYKGSKDTSDFVFKRSIDDATTISHFTGILVDGTAVDEANYTKEPGSVIIRLKPEYLETLALGEHTLTAQFDDGNGSASAAFTVAEKETKPDAQTPTGDKNQPGLWIILMIIAFVSGTILCIFSFMKKLKKQR